MGKMFFTGPLAARKWIWKVHVQLSQGLPSLKLCPCKGAGPQKETRKSSNHPFSGAMLVLGSVFSTELELFFRLSIEKKRLVKVLGILITHSNP